jgi:dynein heavy chain
MEIMMITSFFKGLAASGSWICFDEFNRINIEVLSVIAQQLLHLFGEKGKGSKECIFEDSHIKMKPTFNVYITMNPGYAGRTELPDNLKALFRPVAMMVPDYALIGEIRLYSFGFTKASILANKMVTTFKLCSEQLSSQDHYDYGMRAVASVINAAGLLNLNPLYADATEDQIMLSALRDVNVPKFLKDDLPLFENIISDLFPGITKPTIDLGQLMIKIRETCLQMKLQSTQPFIDKIVQLYDTCAVRHGLMLVGPTGGGKTSNYKVLAAAQSALKGIDEFKKTHYHILNPKAITMEQLYGGLDPATNEWNDGIAAILVAEAAKDESDDKHWIMFDGPVDALWIESMNTVLDDNKKLCLNSGAIINLTAHMTMMFEVEDLAVASPATVSRCGMIYMEPAGIGIQPLIQSWMMTLPASMKMKKTTIPMIEKLFERYVEPLIIYVRKNCHEPVFTVDNNLACSFFRLLDCYMVPYFDTEMNKVTAEEIDDFEQTIEGIFIFCATWTIGATTNLEGRAKFNIKIRDIMGKDSKFKHPSQGNCYDYKFETVPKEWKYWTETISDFAIDPKAQYSEIIVPTFDSIRMKFIKGTLLREKKHVLSPGPTGTGKTVNVGALINLEMSEDYSSVPLTFSAQTSANLTQDSIDGKVEKRRKGIYGPPVGKRLIFFVDDLNMPKKEEYGA